MTWLPPAIVLDLDDTIINFTGMAEECWRTVCDEQAPLLGLDGARLHAALMVERVAFWSDPESNQFGRRNLVEASRLIVARAFAAVGAGSDEQAAELSQLYTARRHTLVHLFPDAISTIETLRERGHRLAMVTNGAAESQREKIVRFDLARHFDAIVVEGEFGIGKPDERVYRHVLSQLGVEPTDALMAGDDLERDVLGPQRVGMRGVWVDRSGAFLAKTFPSTTHERPFRVIQHLAELLASEPH